MKIKMKNITKYILVSTEFVTFLKQNQEISNVRTTLSHKHTHTQVTPVSAWASPGSKAF